MANRILLLARDPDLTQLLREYLRSCGFEVVEPRSDEEARKRAADGSVDGILAESSRLRETGLDGGVDSLPIVALIDMDQPHEATTADHVRNLPKPASLRDIARTLAEVGILSPATPRGGDP